MQLKLKKISLLRTFLFNYQLTKLLQQKITSSQQWISNSEYTAFSWVKPLSLEICQFVSIRKNKSVSSPFWKCGYEGICGAKRARPVSKGCEQWSTSVKPCSTEQEWEQSGFTQNSPSGKLVGDLLQDLPPGSCLGRKVTDGVSYKQKSIGKPRKCSWRKNYKQTNKLGTTFSLINSEHNFNILTIFSSQIGRKIAWNSTILGRITFQIPNDRKMPSFRGVAHRSKSTALPTQLSKTCTAVL